MNPYSFLRDIQSKAWAIEPDALMPLVALALRRMAEGPEPEAAMPSARGAARRAGAIGVLPIRGVITHHPGIWELLGMGTSADRMSAALREAVEDPDIKAVVLDIDSPGGEVAGTPELADEIYAARSSKPIIAVANSMAASAAYYLGSQATEFYATPSGSVGSIGVYSMHVDYSDALAAEGIKPTFIHAGKHKVDGNPYEPLGDEARAHMQHTVDLAYDAFVRAVARGRKTSQTAVRQGMGQGRLVDASEAVAPNMIDGVRTLDAVLAELSGGGKPSRRRAAIARERLALAKAR